LTKSGKRIHRHAASAPRVLVTDARLGSAVAIIRSLGRRGMHVIAADSRPVSAGFYSRFASERLRYPPPETAPDELVDTLLRAARSKRIDLIFPVTDEVILPLSAAREEFESTSVLALPDARALATTQDKVATFDLARELGIAAPRTTVVTTVSEALAAAPSIGWPLVIKPRASRAIQGDARIDSFGVAYANTAGELERRMRELEGRSSALLQEYCHGEARGVGLLMHHGTPVSGFEYRRLREVPITGGPSSFRESVPLDGLHYDSAVRLLAALRWTGLAMVEFKGPPEAPKLIEINGRVWGSLALAVKSGVDFPAQAAQLYLNRPSKPTGASYGVGVRSRDLRLEISWIISVLSPKREYPFIVSPRRREALAAAGRLLLPRDGFDVLSRDDPRAGLAELAGLGPRLYAKAKRALHATKIRIAPER
jgi:predicted ATP-grasp superfamily ATP-dependent carboligase